MKPSISWQKLYGTSSMDDMRDMIAPLYRLINKLEEAKKIETAKPTLISKDYWRLYAIPAHRISDLHLIKCQEAAQDHWREIIAMVTYQKEY